MTSRLNISVPATLTVLAGQPSLSSLAGLGPGITVSGAGANDTIAVQLVAGNTAATIGVANAAGATIAAHLNTLSLTGTQAQVNAALAGLELDEPVGAGNDVLSLSATDPAALAAGSGFAVDVVPLTGPAFVAPPQSLALQADALNAISGLVLSDPIAAGLAAMGLGDEETLSLTLAVTEGVLLLPGLDGLSGIAASGLGTGTIELSLTADEIGALNTLLAGLEFIGPAGAQGLSYTLWNAAGVLPRTLTYGGIFLRTAGTAVSGVLASGTQTVITGGTVFAGTLAVSGIESVLGTLAGGAIALAAEAALVLPYDNMALSGSSVESGTLAGQQLTLAGSLLAGGPASFGGAVSLAAGAWLEFADGLTAFGTAAASTDAALSLAAGAVVQGNGTLTAGNFSESAVIAGGTLLALGGTTFEIDAGLVTGGAQLQVAGGGVMVLGPISPLYGVFDTVPLTIDSSVTLSFLGAGAEPVTGGYASTLGGAGGAFVLGGPQYFSGTVSGFGVGDALIFPDLESISIYNVGTSSFSMAGLDVFGNTDTYTIYTSIAAGYAPAAGQDAQGDEEVFMRAPAATVTQAGALAATAGVPQPLLGISIAMTGSNTQSLSLTLSAALGELSYGGSAAAEITLSAANITALNDEIAAVSYSGTGNADSVVFTSNSGLLAGLTGSVIIAAGAAGTVSGYAGAEVTQADWVSFGLASGLPLVITPLAAGAVLVTGTAELAGVLHAIGLGGTALLVDGAGEAIFGAGAMVSLGAGITLGDAAGAGSLMVLSDDFNAAGNVTLAQAAAAAGSEAAVLGAMSIAGSLVIGDAAAATMLAEGTLDAGALGIGTAGTLQALGIAQIGLGSIGNAGTILVTGAAQVAASAYQGAGVLDLGGTAMFAAAGLISLAGAAAVSIGSGAEISAGSFIAAGGALFDAGLLSVGGGATIGNLQLAGGTLAAASLRTAGTVSGFGVIAAPAISNAGTIEALDGRLLLTGSVSGSAGLEIGPGAVLEIGGTVAPAPVTFAGTDAVLTLDDAAAAGFSVVQMAPSDGIDLVGIAPSLVSFPGSGGGTGAILNSQGGTAASFSISLAAGLNPHVSVFSDGAGGSLLTADGILPCFARGTGILSPHGYRKIETLRPNDPVITAQGARRPVRWIGWRVLDLGPDAARAARPVLILPNAFGPGKPAKMLRLSPSHCVFTGGVLIPAAQLVNGATVLRDHAAQAASYFHIELDRHDVVVAEGLACESYFDDGNRASLYQELGRRCPARRLCAPVVSSGARLAAARRALHEQALACGFSTRFQPVLRAVAEGQSAIPQIMQAKAGRVARFRFARPVRGMVLLSATASPADTDPCSEDRRELGVCLNPARGVVLAAGWQPRAAGDIGSWMGARAELAWARARTGISLPLAAIAQSWHRPPVDAARRGG